MASLLGLGVLAGCGVEADGSAAPAAESSAQAPAAAESRSQRRKVDRGFGAFVIGEREIATRSASARLREGRLRIGMARNETEGDVVKRDDLTLVIDDFDGPGEYRSSTSGSSFVSVGMNVAKARAAGDDEAAAAKVAMAGLSGAEHVGQIAATVHVTAVGDGFIDGTFEWTPPEGSQAPPIRDGRFHARIRE